MPLIVGAPASKAKEIGSNLQKAGYEVTYVKGPPAPNPGQDFHIESQRPDANTPLKPGQPILLRYYDKWVPPSESELSRTVNEGARQ
jgi:hypothetical protein